MWQVILRWIFRQMALLTALLVIAGILIGAWLDQEIFSPPRRALQNYHLERLQHPAQFGLRIRSYACLAGNAPCLLVEPDAQAGAGERGRKLREQLLAKGFSVPTYGTVKGIVVLLHGRNGRKEDLLPVAERFVAAGFRCLIPDLPGHGDSPLRVMAFGSSTFERTLPRQILADAREHFHLPDEPAALWGLSMGGAFAVSAASESPQIWSGLMVVSSFATLDSVMERQIPAKWRTLVTSTLLPFINMAQFLQGQPSVAAMTPQRWAQHIVLPALIVHGDKDAFIPLQQGRNLYTALASPQKRWLTVPDGGHANILSTTMPLYAEMSAWLLQTLPRQTLVSTR